MALALQCPECGHRHPLDDLSDQPTFRCESCGRLLKVPSQARPAPDSTRAAPAAARPLDETSTIATKGTGAGGVAATALTPATTPGMAPGMAPATRVPPSRRLPGDDQFGSPPSVRVTHTRSRSALPRSIRALVWLLALPLGILPVVMVGRSTGVLTMDAAVDVYLGIGWGRFVPLLLVLPVWAAMSAAIAHVVIEGLTRLVRGRAPGGAARPAPPQRLPI